MPTLRQSADKVAVRAERILHDAHLRYQRQQLAPNASGSDVPADNVVRGVKRERGNSELKAYAQNFRVEWFTHLRPNFWKGYFETLTLMAK